MAEYYGRYNARVISLYLESYGVTTSRLILLPGVRVDWTVLDTVTGGSHNISSSTAHGVAAYIEVGARDPVPFLVEPAQGKDLPRLTTT